MQKNMPAFKRNRKVSEDDNNIVFEDLGLFDYQEAWDYQEERLNKLV